MTDAELPPEPRRPDGVAAYILDGVDRQDDPETLRAIAAYADARADHLEALEDRDVDAEAVVDDDEELVDAVNGSGSMGVIVEKKIPCGKDCDGCPHGPYKYRAYRDGDTVRTEYLGKA